MTSLKKYITQTILEIIVYWFNEKKKSTCDPTIVQSNQIQNPFPVECDVDSTGMLLLSLTHKTTTK